MNRLNFAALSHIETHIISVKRSKSLIEHTFLSFSGEVYGVGHNHWFLFVIVTSFIITLLWCFFYLLQLREAILMKLPFSWLWLVRILKFVIYLPKIFTISMLFCKKQAF